MPKAIDVIKQFYPQVKTVIAAKKWLTVEVLPTDGRKGRKKHRACAMADACKRKFHLDGAMVARTTAYLVKGAVATRYQLPSSVQREIVSFDRGAGFAPGLYRLAPAETQYKHYAPQGKNSGKYKRNRKKLVPGLRAAVG